MTPTNRALVFALVPIFILLGLVGGLAIYYTQALREKQDWIIHTYRVINAADMLLSDLWQSAGSQRGILLTGNDIYIRAYNEGRRNTLRDMTTLRELSSYNERRIKKVNELEPLVQKRLDLLQRGLDIRAAQDFKAAAAYTNMNSGGAVMDEITSRIQTMTNEEELLLQNRSRDAAGLESRTTLVAYTGVVLALLFLLVITALLLRNNLRLSRVEKTLAEKAALLQATLDNIRDGVVAFDAMGRLRAFNKHFFEFLDFPREMAVDGAPLEKFREIDTHRGQPVLQELPIPGEDGGEGYQRIALNNREMDVYRSALADGGFLVAAIDVTARERSDAIMRQAQKMETIGHLTGGLAHDFNNLLQIISANLDLMTGDVQGDPRASGRLQNAISGVERGSRLTQQLLAFARRQPLNPQAINLGRTIRGMTDLLRSTLGERIDVEAVVSGGLWNTSVDPVQIENGILNLAINARDAMPDGGKLTIEVSNAVLDDAYAMGHVEVTPGQYVMLAVSDTGSGMSPEVASRAFEPFFTTKREGEGTGLGLSQIYGFVKQSGGHVKIYTEVGHGTSVKLYLPRARKGLDEYSSPLSPASGGTETILVVEDDAGVRAAAIDLLKELGYAVLKAENADEALALLESGARPDLLFTDVVMPGTINTRDFARQAQEICSNLRVLFTSGYTQNAIVHNGRLDDDVFLLSKPYRKDELARKVRSVLDTGSNSTTRMPVAVEAPAPQEAPMQLHILVVEDEMLVRMSTVDMLERLEHHVVEAEDGLSALAILQSARKLDLLITDLGLSGFSGQELVVQARRLRPGIKVIVASGYELPEDMTDAGHIGKPFQLEDIRKAIADIMGEEG